MEREERYSITIVIIGIIILLIVFTAGFMIGVNTTIKKGVYLAGVLMNDGTLNISYDNEVLNNLIRRYVSSTKLEYVNDLSHPAIRALDPDYDPLIEPFQQNLKGGIKK